MVPEPRRSLQWFEGACNCGACPSCFPWMQPHTPVAAVFFSCLAPCLHTSASPPDPPTPPALSPPLQRILYFSCRGLSKTAVELSVTTDYKYNTGALAVVFLWVRFGLLLVF